MKSRARKPDLMWVLVLVIGFGVLATGFAQDYIRDQQSQVPVTQVANK
ncbi:MAG: hypothetical protein OEX03_10885 [Gammaproteobacteria bacterium]|nr:hypothetical protein [Gammaproteobacteria bacterium]